MDLEKALEIGFDEEMSKVPYGDPVLVPRGPSRGLERELTAAETKALDALQVAFPEENLALLETNGAVYYLFWGRS